MGYTTQFLGRFELNKQLTLDDYRALEEFAKKDHREESYCPEYSYYCQWTPTEDGRGIEWDGSEKFYGYVEWLLYLIDHFLIPKEYVLSGTVKYQGEEVGDSGDITVKNNEVVKTEFDASECEIEELVRLGLKDEECGSCAYHYLEKIAEKLNIENK